VSIWVIEMLCHIRLCNTILPPLQVMDFLVFEVLCVCEETSEDKWYRV